MDIRAHMCPHMSGQVYMMCLDACTDGVVLVCVDVCAGMIIKVRMDACIGKCMGKCA